MFNIVSSKLTTSSSGSGWSQVYEHLPADKDFLDLRGKLYLLVADKEKEGDIGTLSLCRNAFGNFCSDYYKDPKVNASDLFKSSLEKMLASSLFFENAQVAALLVLGPKIYMFASGGSGVYVLRNGILVKIVKSVKNARTYASGLIQSGDIIFAATDDFFETIPEGELKQKLSQDDFGAVASSLELFVDAHKEVKGAGGLTLKFTEEKSIETNSAPLTDFLENGKLLAPNKFFAKIKNSISTFTTKLPRRDIYIKADLTNESNIKNKKTTFTVGLILLALLVVSIGFGVKQKRTVEFRNKYKGIILDVQNNLDQAISLANVSPDKSRELFLAAQKEVEELEKLEVKDPKLGELKQKIEDGRSAILGEFLNTPEMYLDLTLLTSGFKGDLVSFSGGQVYVLDTSGSRVIGVDLASKKSKVVAGPGVISAPLSLASYEDSVFVLQNDGIFKTGTSSLKVVDKDWSGEAFISVFAGNMYVLNKEAGQIYRYQGVGGSFGGRQDWLSSAASANFSDAKQFVIDGSVYVLLNNSKILKYSQGSPMGFSLTGVYPEIGSVDAIAAGPDNQYIYLLDKAGKRVVVTDKKGSYKAQYINDMIGGANGLVVSENDGKIILLTGDKLYSIDIKN